jgi:hypothetical protein
MQAVFPLQKTAAKLSLIKRFKLTFFPAALMESAR